MHRVFDIALVLALVVTTFGLARPAAAQDSATPELEVVAEGEHGEETMTPVLAEIIGVDTAAVRANDGLYYVVYEIRLTNTSAGQAQLEAITVLDADDGTEVIALGPEEINATESLRLLNRAPTTEMTIPSNEGRIVMLTLTFASPEAVPSALAHRLDVLSQDPFAPDTVPFSYEVAPLDLSQRAVPVLSPPLAGEGWIAGEGCCDPVSHHRNGMFPINGTYYAGQRYGIDFIQVDEEGFLVQGDYRDPQNWVGYGAPVLAVGDGEVIATQDGLPDQVPSIMPDQSQMELSEIEGNHVVIALDNGFYAFYGHLQPGSVQVAVGQRVTAGEQLAAVGNTGGSQAPHLHFHIVGERSAAAAYGFPFVFDSFLVSGAADSDNLLAAIEGEASFPRDPGDPVLHENEMPLSYVMIDFPPREAAATSGRTRNRPRAGSHIRRGRHES